jgi:predicted molibdopterin-dependent oxidoreductase YjgC
MTLMFPPPAPTADRRAGCNLQLHVKDDYIFKVTSPFDAVVNQGNLCVKGRFGYDYIYHPKRVTKPLGAAIPVRRKTSTRDERTEI